MHHILTLNSFNFNNRYYLQTKGCAMGTVAAPSYAIIFMGKFEETYIYPEINSDCLFYVRYIDDIFFIYTGGELKLHNFLQNLNSKHTCIKFDYELSSTSVAFLDTRIYIDNNRLTQTTLHTKPTDCHNYLHAKSAHPTHLKNNLPYSQALRIRRICSENHELHKHYKYLTQYFLERGYPNTLIVNQIKKALTIPRQDTLKLTHKDTPNRIPLITTFHHALPPLAKIIKNRWDILTLKPDFREIFKDPGILAYRRPKNISDFISSNTIINDKVSRKNYNPKSIKFCKPCKNKNSLCCNHLKHTSSFISHTTKKTFNIYHDSNCRTRNIIYLLECAQCNLQYIGKSEWPFNIRLNNYRHRIKSNNLDNLLPIEKHFKLPNHSFSADAKFTIIEKIEIIRTFKLTHILEKRENFWIKRLNTLLPYGLNTKLNNTNYS